MYRIIMSLFVLGAFAIAACKKTADLKSQMVANPVTQAEKDKNAILKYAIDSSFAIEALDSTGIWYEIKEAGSGTALNDTSAIKIGFDIYDLKGKLVNSSKNAGKPQFLQAAMLGPSFKSLIPKMKEKTKVALFVPSNDGSFRNPEPIRMMLTILEVGTPESIKKERQEMEAQMQAMQKEAQERLANEPANIQKYITDNKLTGYKSTPDGIWYNISAPGSAAHPKAENTVKVHYKGTLLDGSEFDSSYSRGEPAEFPLGGVIQGWQKAIPLLGKGGKGTFIIPSGLAYGEQSPSPAIPPNSTLVFEVELLDIK